VAAAHAPDHGGGPPARRLLFDDARVAKERLSRSPAADLTVPLLNIDVHLNREELEDLADPCSTRRSGHPGRDPLGAAGGGPVAGVFLVGGSSRIPLVATMLHRALGEAPVAIEQPELVVAEGSLVGGAAPTPVSAGPAPGPATGVMPRVPGFPTPRARGAGNQAGQPYAGNQAGQPYAGNQAAPPYPAVNHAPCPSPAAPPCRSHRRPGCRSPPHRPPPCRRRRCRPHPSPRRPTRRHRCPPRPCPHRPPASAPSRRARPRCRSRLHLRQRPGRPR
jgi:hypothetical protein